MHEASMKRYIFIVIRVRMRNINAGKLWHFCELCLSDIKYDDHLALEMKRDTFQIKRATSQIWQHIGITLPSQPSSMFLPKTIRLRRYEESEYRHDHTTHSFTGRPIVSGKSRKSYQLYVHSTTRLGLFDR